MELLLTFAGGIDASGGRGIRIPLNISVTRVTGVTEGVNYMYSLEITGVTPRFGISLLACYRANRCNASERG